MPYALIKDGVIQNTIIADATFVEIIRDQWDDIVEISDEPGSPGISWKHDGKEFLPPEPTEPVVDEIQEKKNDAEFGSNFLIEFSIFNEKRKLSDDEKLILAKELAPIKTLIYEGDLRAACNLLLKTPIIAKLLTPEIVADLATKITDYLESKT